MLQIEFDVPIPEKVPAELPIYAVEKVSVDRRYVIDILSRLNLMGKLYSFTWERTDTWTDLTGQSARVAINHNSGAFRFKIAKSDRDTLEIPFSISRPNLERIAREFVSKSRLVDEPNQQLKINEINYLYQQAQSITGETSEVRILDAGVVFGREINGVPVKGSGGFITINIAADETVTGGIKVWRRLGAEIEKAKILDPDFAVRKLMTRLRDRDLDAKVRINRADFCYFEMGLSALQRFFEPTYTFVFETETNGFPYKSEETIPAVQRTRENWSDLPSRPVA